VNKKLRIGIATLLISLVLAQSGCGRAGLHALRAISTIAAVATILAVHDAHFHSHHCGHQYMMVEERPVYHYQGRWEYYDEHDANWYYYNGSPE
jgi:hypothetical protein